jgi:membrane protein
LTQGVKVTARRLGGFLYRVWRRFTDDDALNKAAALSYTSLLSLVPLLAIGLAILAAFPAFESARAQLQRALIGNLVPEVGKQVRDMIDGFVSNAGNLTAVGIISLIVTAVLLLYNIEDAMNRVFRVTRQRSPMSRLLVYWSVLTLGPVLLAASLSISAFLFSPISDNPLLSGLVAIGSSLFRFAMLVALFTFLFAAMPARSVPLGKAAIGGFASAIGVAVLRFGFHIYVVDMHAYQSLYGALAAVPIMLFWMYLAWTVVLGGAELTASLIDIEEEGRITPSLPSSAPHKDGEPPTS